MSRGFYLPPQQYVVLSQVEHLEVLKTRRGEIHAEKMVLTPRRTLK